MERKLAEPGLLDGVAVDLGGPRTAAFFEKCNRHIPWKKLADSLQGLYDEHDKGGREPWPVILMVKHLETCGLVMNKGALVDATMVEAPKGRKREDGTSTRDPEASFTKKHGRTYHGT